jgi:hypothetical protein
MFVALGMQRAIRTGSIVIYHLSGSKILVYGRSPAAIAGSNPIRGMDICLLCCQVEVSATSYSLVQRSPTDCGASLCVIKKPRETSRP